MLDSWKHDKMQCIDIQWIIDIQQTWIFKEVEEIVKEANTAGVQIPPKSLNALIVYATISNDTASSWASLRMM